MNVNVTTKVPRICALDWKHLYPSQMIVMIHQWRNYICALYKCNFQLIVHTLCGHQDLFFSLFKYLPNILTCMAMHIKTKTDRN